MAAQSRLCALGVLELDYPGSLDCLLTDPKESGGYLGDDVIFIWGQGIRVAALAGAGEGVKNLVGFGSRDEDGEAYGTEAHTAAIYREPDLDLRGIIVTSPIQGH